MIVPPPVRHLRAELLDLDKAPYEEVKDSLKDVERVNRYLSGYRVLLEHVRPFLAEHRGPRPFTLLDAATGSADQIAAAIAVHIAGGAHRPAKLGGRLLADGGPGGVRAEASQTPVVDDHLAVALPVGVTVGADDHSTDDQEPKKDLQ